jgi:threonine/homoserine/homoserine lactone efflux protein
MPGTVGFQARIVVPSTAASTAGSYKTAPAPTPSVVDVDQFAALVVFAFVSSVTPGPNNILLWASGAEFGLRRTVPHIVGTALGIGSMALAVAAGLGVLITTVPQIAIAMKIVGSVYLLYLAWRVAGARALERGDLARPLCILQAAAFQAINPKAWIFALGAITTFRPTALPSAAGSVLVAVTMMAVIVPTAALWAAGGGAISRYLVGDGRQRIVSLVLAALLVATIVAVWV